MHARVSVVALHRVELTLEEEESNVVSRQTA
jgi:hypothetical protein